VAFNETTQMMGNATMVTAEPVSDMVCDAQ
jgi:hypothetical protein